MFIVDYFLFLLLVEVLVGFCERKWDWICGGIVMCGKIGEGVIL